MILKEYEVCKYAATCPFNSQIGNDFCYGADSKRSGQFECHLVSDDGVFSEGFRSKHDKTGKMKIIVEGEK